MRARVDGVRGRRAEWVIGRGERNLVELGGRGWCAPGLCARGWVILHFAEPQCRLPIGGGVVQPLWAAPRVRSSHRVWSLLMARPKAAVPWRPAHNTFPTMNDLIFEHYVPVANAVVTGGLVLLIVGMLVFPAKRRVIDCLSSVAIYVAVVALGMSEDIKHPSVIGCAHAATAFTIVILAIRSYRNRASWLLAIPCVLIVVVLVFNMANEQRGLELMGRWTQAP